MTNIIRKKVNLINPFLLLAEFDMHSRDKVSGIL